MSPISFSLPGGLPAAPTALVVEPLLPHLLAVLSALSALGFDTTVAENFQDAKTALATQRPALLVTGVKLREFNGLHLVLRATSTWGPIPAIVTSDREDDILRDEAERLGATFVVMPIAIEDLMAAIARTVLRERVPGKPLEPIRPPFERRSATRPREQAVAQDAPPVERRRDTAAAIRSLLK